MLGAFWKKREHLLFLYFLKSPRCPTNPDITPHPLESKIPSRKQPENRIMEGKNCVRIYAKLSTFRGDSGQSRASGRGEEQSIGPGPEQSINWERTGEVEGVVERAIEDGAAGGRLGCS